MLRTSSKALLATCILSFGLVSCEKDSSYVQANSPTNPYKDYEREDTGFGAIVGVGQPISEQKMKANALMSQRNNATLEQVMHKVAGIYNVGIRWGNGVRKDVRQPILMNQLTFDEARNYLEDVYDIQMIREGERRILLLPASSEKRVVEFNPGNDVSLSDALRGLAQQCDYNIVIPESKLALGGKRVTTNLRDVTCYDAFDALLSPHGFSLEDAGGYFTVAGLPQRQWTLNLHEPDRDETRSVTYSSEFSAEGSETGGESKDFGGTASTDILNERRLWDELTEDLQQLIDNACLDEQNTGSAVLNPPSAGSDFGFSSGGNNAEANCGYLRINRTVGLVQMRAPKFVLDEADEIIRRVEDIAGRRLNLEARVIAVQKTRGFDQAAGVQFGDNVGNTNVFSGFNGPTNSITATLNGLLGSINQSGGFIGAQRSNLDAVMRYVEQFGTTYQLMRPSIELVDRQQAILIDGVTERYFLTDTETTTTDGSVQTSIDVEEFGQFFGLQFVVTAQIADFGDPHTVSLQIPITTKDGDVLIPNGEGNTAPQAQTRLIDQKVRLRDGEVKVIGGLTKTIAIDSEAGVPIFRDIPALGKLGNEESVSFEEVEFVVLLQARRID